jgi:HAD superfamily hydrolase (TIGR01509 family)
VNILKDFSAIIFDMDGVLWNTGNAHAEAFRQILEPLQMPVPDYKDIAGRRTDEVIISIMTSAGIDFTSEQINTMTAAKRSLARKIISSKPPVTAYCYEVLEKLSRHHRLGLVSSANASSVALFLQSSATDKFFAMVMSGESVTKSKPEAEIYIEACRRLAVKTSDVIVVEDSVNGIHAAHLAGIKVIAVRGTSTEEELKSTGVLSIIDDLRQLL